MLNYVSLCFFSYLLNQEKNTDGEDDKAGEEELLELLEDKAALNETEQAGHDTIEQDIYEEEDEEKQGDQPEEIVEQLFSMGWLKKVLK